MLSRVTAKNVGDVFLRHTVVAEWYISGVILLHGRKSAVDRKVNNMALRDVTIVT